jgi:predicted RNA-binding protein with EMAP domain
MSDFQDDNFDKIFSEIAEKEKIENIDNILNEEKIEYAKKYLSIIQSLNYSAIYINDIVTDMILDPDFNIDKEISEIIEKLFVLSEDFHDAIMEMYDGITFELCEEFEIEDEDED